MPEQLREDGRWFCLLGPQDCADKREGPKWGRWAAISRGHQLDLQALPELVHGVRVGIGGGE